MILIIDCTSQCLPLLKEEFVNPLISIIEKSGHATITLPLICTNNIPKSIHGIVISGTALMDNVFQKNGLPQCIKEWTGPVLGICAGMQLLALHAGGSLIPGEEIGMTEIRAVGNDQIFNGKECFSAWELHKYQVLIPDSCITIADSQSGIQAFRYSDKPWYGMLFHPEVRNEWIIDNYLTLCSQTSSSSQK